MSGTVLDIKTVPMACSSMVKDLFLLKAFEAGADAVTVWVCPEGACRHGEGNLRASKRVERLRRLLGDIGLNADRLTLFNVDSSDRNAASDILGKMASTLLSVENPLIDKPDVGFSERPRPAAMNA